MFNLFKKKEWKPTHFSIHDGSTVRLVTETPFVIENECGDQWEDAPGHWAEIDWEL